MEVIHPGCAKNAILRMLFSNAAATPRGREILYVEIAADPAKIAEM
jgi:hypothetical protein